MKVCKKCGNQSATDTDMFCANCGGDLVEKSEFEEFVEANADNNGVNQNMAGDFKNDGYTYSNTSTTGVADEEYFPVDDIEQNKVYAVLAYIGILVLVPILAAKESGYAKFHANQGLVLLITNVIISFAVAIPVIGLIVSLLGIVTFVFMIMGIINAATGKAKRLPIIGKFDIYK